MILFRCFPWAREARSRDEGGALWFPRAHQGTGRHDNPDLYGCLYLSELELSPVVERLARFRLERRVAPFMLEREGRPLALATIRLPDDAPLLDLDDPRVLARERLRPSGVATRDRARTQAAAAALYDRHPEAAAIRWWSTFEASWPNLTVFDRVARRLRVQDVRALSVFDPAVREAADFLGLG